MPQITVSQEVYDRLTFFQQVRQGLMDDGEDWSVDQLAELLLPYAIESSLSSLWEQVDKEVLVKTLQLLTSKNPAPVCELTAELLKLGASVRKEQQEAELPFGFRHPPALASQP
jgi:hypothetical protein